MNKTVPLGPFLGMNNLRPVEKLATKDGAFVLSAVNLDLTEAGSFKRRAGATQKVAGVDIHSLWSNGQNAYAADYGTLHWITENAGVISKTPMTSVTPGLTMSYADTPVGVYASNGTQFLRLVDGAAYPATVPTPLSTPVLTSTSGGSLPAGSYQVVISHVASDGEEGGTTEAVRAHVDAGGKLVISSIPMVAGYSTIVYVSPPDSSTFMRVAADVATWTVSVLPQFGEQPPGYQLAPIPAGTCVAYLNGRLITAAGSALYYSEPYQPGLMRPSRNYIPFPAEITMVLPCQNGVYVGADQTYWIGGDLTEAEVLPVLPYGAVRGTGGAVPNSNDVFWMSDRGMVRGTQTGEVSNLQESNVAMPVGLGGASLYREQNGLKQMISTLFSPQETVLATRAYMDAEIVRKEA